MEEGNGVMRENPLLGIYKICNNGTNVDKYNRIVKHELELPRYLDVELTNCCNFRCCFCPTGTKSIKRPKGFMQDEVVDALIENVKKYHIPAVRFIRWGEPTLHPKYLDIIEKVKQTGSLIHINTNGSLITDEQIQKMVDMQLDSIKISFQGADEGTYNEMREGGDYNRLLQKVRRLHEIRGERELPYIQISTTLTRETVEQIESFKNDIEEYCDYYNVGYTQLTHLNVENMNIDNQEKKKIRELQEYEKNNHKYICTCPEAFDKLSINWNGDVTLCCSDYDNFMIVGNILDMDLRQIFISEEADKYRKIVLSGEWSKIKCCSNCYEIISTHK